jgi:hypothetical protein
MQIITKKLSQQPGDVVIAQDVNVAGAKQFIGLRSHQDIFPYVESQVAKNYHEIMTGLGPRRLYFDFDRTVAPFPPIYDFMENFKETLIIAVDQLFGEVLDPYDILFAQSEGSAKFSVHIHVPTFNTSVKNLRMLYYFVNKCLVATDPMLEGLDSQVYKRNQSLRLVGCSKMGKSNTLDLLTTNCKDTDTLAGYLSDSKKLCLRPALQKKV